MRRLITAILALGALPAGAQTATEALAAQWNTICATAADGQLLVRCTETATSSDPNADLVAATGQRLEEIPGQARIAARSDGGAIAGGLQVRAGTSLAELATDPSVESLGLRLSEQSGASDNRLAPRWSLFANIETGRLDRKQGPNEAAFEAGSEHLTIGADWRVGAHGVAGAMFVLDREDLDYSDSFGRAEARYRGVIGFASYAANDAWTFDSYLGSARGGYDLVRWINYSLPVVGGGSYAVDALAYASPDSHRSIAGLGADWNWARAGWQGDVGFGFDYSKTDIDAYTESDGGGLALEVPERRIETQRGRLDASFGRTVSTPWGVWQPSLRVGWRQEFANERRQVTVRLAEDTLNNPITFDTEDPDRGWGEIAFGNVFVFTRGHSGFFEFRQRFAHSFLNERILALGWRMEL